jgi:hypothetical protein
LKKLLAILVVSALLIGLAVWLPQSGTCPFTLVLPAKLAGRLEGRTVQSSADPLAFVFHSMLKRNDDGGPNAYHIGYNGISSDPGLDHICNGGSVLEYQDGRLIDKYRAGGSIGSLTDIDPGTGWSRSALCKEDYIKLRDAGFPACSPANQCMLWYGIASTSRACGYPNDYDGVNDQRCGVPIRQLDSKGDERPYYLTKTSLRRLGSHHSSLQQSDYANANELPFIVLPKGFTLPGNVEWNVGDLALVFWKLNMVTAVVGDKGPRGKLGEGSRELLRQLRGNGSTTIEGENAVVTILLPKTSSKVVDEWPIDPKQLARIGAVALSRFGGVEKIKTCPTFSSN